MGKGKNMKISKFILIFFLNDSRGREDRDEVNKIKFKKIVSEG